MKKKIMFGIIISLMLVAIFATVFVLANGAGGGQSAEGKGYNYWRSKQKYEVHDGGCTILRRNLTEGKTIVTQNCRPHVQTVEEVP